MTELPIEELTRQLREQAARSEEFSKRIANAKSERNQAAGDEGAFYGWGHKEQTIQWKAVECIDSLAAQLREAEAYKPLVKRLSEALRKVRPMGGSELFIRFNDNEFYADPEYCGAFIDMLRSDLHEVKCANAQSSKTIATLTAQVEGLEKAKLRRDFRAAVTWLHSYADSMNDPHARSVLHMAASHLGDYGAAYDASRSAEKGKNV